MRTLDLQRLRTARVWLGGLPDAAYTPAAHLTRSIAVRGALAGASKMAAVEIFVPVGGRFMHGLLGGHFDPDGSDRLLVTVGLSSRTDIPFENGLTNELEDAHIGLLPEYGEAVLEGVEDACSRVEVLGGGLLTFRHAVHGDVGSSSVFFRALASIVVELLPLGDAPTDAALQNVIENELLRLSKRA